MKGMGEKKNPWLDTPYKKKLFKLWVAVYGDLKPLIDEIEADLWLEFNRLQREVNGNIRRDPQTSELYDRDKHRDRVYQILQKAYKKAEKKAVKRVLAETGEKKVDEGARGSLKVQYLSYLLEYSAIVERTTYKRLLNWATKYLNGEIDLKTYKEKLREVFKSFKTNRTGLIAKTEVYRAFNTAYFTYMVGKGYFYKVWVSGYNPSPDSKSGRLHGVKKFFVERFKVEEFEVLFPPLHPNDISTLLCVKA